MDKSTKNIKVKGYDGTWFVVDIMVTKGTEYFLLQHEDWEYKSYIIIDSKYTLVLDNAEGGFNDLFYELNSLKYYP